MLAFLYKYRIPIGLSLALHFTIICLFFVYKPSSGQSLFQTPPQPTVVQATAVNSAEVNKQIQDIQQQVLRRQNAEQQHLKQVQQQADAAKEAQAKAQENVEKLKAEQEQMKEAKIQRAQELAELQHKAEIQKKKLIAEKAREKKMKMAEAVKKKQALAKKSQELQKKLMAQQLAQENNQLNKMQDAEKAQAAKAEAAQAQQNAALVSEYTSKILGAIGDNWNIAPGTSKDLKVQYLIHVAPDGTVLSASLVQTSGDPVLDDSAKVAILKSSPLPVPKDSVEFAHFKEFRLTLSPQRIKDMSGANA